MTKLKRSRQRENVSKASVSEYQVFLSFRGPDSRQGLSSVLCSDMTTAGLRVFRDDDELEIGDEISEILPAISNSKICVPIFSRTFAASTWCLREVERMVSLEKKIMPIFYTASPDDVKLKTELFKADLRKHEAKHGADKVGKWEDALKAVARIKGLEVKNTGYAEFSKKFVKTLLIKLKVKMKYVTDALVKRDYQKEALMESLDIGADDVRIVVGIHGLGGTGKTTLAAVVFNGLLARFDCLSFLEDIGETVRRNGLQYLHQKLLEDLDPKLKDFRDTDPIRMLETNFCNRKVLIILDNVDERKQVKMIVGVLGRFGSGSRIIITARDRRVFTEEARALEVKEMNENEALQLFSRHAFGEDSPPSDDYEMLSHEVVCLTGRLPLALEVVGSLLQGCNENEWKKHIHKLKKVPNRDVLEKLKLSFDALDEEQKQIFLDISCFFINKDVSRAIYVWEACELFPDEGIKVLQSMSLVEILDGKFWMHDLIRDLGRELVRRECTDDPAKRSRIWSDKEAREVLKMKQGKKKVQGLFLEEPFDSNLTNKEFSSFRRLRLLKLVGTKLIGDFEHILPQLRWFSWHQCPLDFIPTKLSLGKLVVLDLSQSLITETWAGWGLLKMAKNLKELDLTDCCNLKSTPDLSDNEALEGLILRGCRNIARVHSSIRKLKRLRHLNLQGCCSSLISVLSVELGSLDLSSLEFLDLSRTSVTEKWAGWSLLQRAKNLKVLDLTECRNLKSTPDFSDNEALEILILRGCDNLARIDSSIGRLKRLKHLDLRDSSSLTDLPEEIGLLENLEVLDIRMGGALGSLKKLRILDAIEFYRLERVPQPYGWLNVTRLDLSECTSLEMLPDAIGDLKSLVELNLKGTNLSALPDTIGGLTKLQFLSLESKMIEELPESVADLPKLHTLLMDVTTQTRKMGRKRKYIERREEEKNSVGKEKRGRRNSDHFFLL